MKAIRSNTKISPHGGAVPILKKIKEFGIPQVIRSTLGVRKKQSRYGYEDIFIAWVLTALCGGTRLDHITKLKKKLNIIPGLKLPSHDTLGRVMKQLATETITKANITKERNAKYTYCKYNDNILLNDMLIKATKQMGLLKEAVPYTLDIDATFIWTACHEAQKTYSSTESGFNPMVCLIGNLPVFISMRGGNVSGQSEIKNCLEQCLNLLAANKIRIGKVISDGAAYNVELMEMLHAKNIKFVIHTPFHGKNYRMQKTLDGHKHWKRIELETANNFWDCEIADIPYQMFDRDNSFRLITVRTLNPRLLKGEEAKYNEERRAKLEALRLKDALKKRRKHYGPGKWKAHGKYLYKLIISNDFNKSAEELMLEYNNRGNAERKFDMMKNDFAWRLPPFMRLNQNTVFLIAAALANNVFRAMVSIFQKQVPELRLNSRLREFQFVFIDVACQYLGRGLYKFFNTDIAFEKIV